MKINFYCIPSKKGKDGKSPINIDISLNGKRIIIFSGERCNPSDKTWNGSRAIGKEPFKDQINSNLDNIELKIKKLEADSKTRGIVLTKELIKDTINDTPISGGIPEEEAPIASIQIPDDFFLSYEKFLEESKNGIRKIGNGKRMGSRAIQSHTTTLSHLKNFAEKKKFFLTFNNVNEAFYNKFCTYMWDDLGHYDNTVGKYIINLKAFLTWSEKTAEHKKKYFRKMSEEKDIVVLTPEQLNLLIDTEITEKSVISYFNSIKRTIEVESISETASMLARTKDILVIGCTTTLRVGDLLKLTKEKNLMGDSTSKLRVKTTKTGKEVIIDLPPYAEEIIKKHIGKQATLLPKISEQRFNENLKKLGEYMGWHKITVSITRMKRFEPVTQSLTLSSLLTSHVMRRTGITTLLIAGMNEYAVKRISGHTKNSKSFSKYIEFSQQYINQEFQAAWENIRSRGYGKPVMKIG